MISVYLLLDFNYFILFSPASSFVSSMVSTSAATLVLVSAVIAVLAIVVVGVEIRIETLFLLVLEEAGTLLFLIAELGSGCGYCISDVSIRISAGTTLALGSSAYARIIIGRTNRLVVEVGLLALETSAMISAEALLIV